ncbi:MAG: hypothetical protein ABJK11_01970 [Balneola sp.]
MKKLSTYTNDLLTYNKHFLSAIRSQKTSETVTNPKAVDLLHNIDIAVTNQINELENFDDLVSDSTTDEIKDKIASAFGTIAGNVDSLRKDPISKILRDDYTALSMMASGYTMLYTAALTYERERLANFAKESLSRIAQLITECSQIIPFVVADELSDESKNSNEIAEKALEETQKAWDVKNTMVEA